MDEASAAPAKQKRKKSRRLSQSTAEEAVAAAAAPAASAEPAVPAEAAVPAAPAAPTAPAAPSVPASPPSVSFSPEPGRANAAAAARSSLAILEATAARGSLAGPTDAGDAEEHMRQALQLLSTVGGEASRPPVPAGSRRASLQAAEESEEVVAGGGGLRRLRSLYMMTAAASEMVRKHVHEPEGSDALQFRGVPKWISYQHIRGFRYRQIVGIHDPGDFVETAHEHVTYFGFPGASGWAANIGCVALHYMGDGWFVFSKIFPFPEQARNSAQFGAIRRNSAQFGAQYASDARRRRCSFRRPTSTSTRTCCCSARRRTST